jgi:hypothetical protein
MPLTLTDIFQKLREVDEITLLEVLNITSEDIVSRFEDKIEEQADRLEKELEEDFNE